MCGDDEFEVCYGLPSTFGWLRRKDLENADDAQVWEDPKGQITKFPPGATPTLFRPKISKLR